MRHFYTISELTEIYHITTRTLRYYEEIGLVLPRRRGTQRLYTQADRERIQLILRARRLGFGLEEIRELLDLYDTDPANVTHLEDVLNRGNRKIREVEKQLHDLQALHSELLDVRDRMMQALEDRTRETAHSVRSSEAHHDGRVRSRHVEEKAYHGPSEGYERARTVSESARDADADLLVQQSDSRR